MYVIVVNVYDEDHALKLRRIWRGHVFDSREAAQLIADTTLVDGDCILIVKELR